MNKPEPSQSKKEVTVIIFGATGNLTKVKLLPALESLLEDRVVGDSLQIIAVGRREIDDDEYYELMRQELRTGLLRSRISYFRGGVGVPGGLEKLPDFLVARGLDYTNLIFYCATPPELYEQIARQLVEAGLMNQNPSGPFRRAVFEKPLGNDLISASLMLEAIYGRLSEDQVILVDHYLGKEAIQNLIVLRFLNETYEATMRSDYVQNIQITIAESVGIEERGQYYDDAGVIRDMLQSHVLQIIAFLTMERPEDNRPEVILKRKLQAIKNIRFASPLEENLVLGQYEGYQEEKHVKAGSDTPTYVALRLFVADGPLKDVPILVRTGKALKKRHARIVIQFKPKRSPFSGEDLEGNRIVVTIQPDAWIMSFFKHKVPGLTMAVKEVVQCFFREESFIESPREGYQRIFYEIIEGNRLFFTNPDEVIASWVFVDRLIAAASQKGVNPVSYPRGIDELPESREMLARLGLEWYEQWHTFGGQEEGDKAEG